jgi:hypothetical protein
MSLTNPRHAETVEPAVPITTPTEALQRVAAALALAEEKAEIGAKTSCSLLLSLAREYRALAKVIGEAEKDGES